MREVLKANEGMILTDGNIYGVEIFLAEGVAKDRFYEISYEEYQTRLDEEEREIIDG